MKKSGLITALILAAMLLSSCNGNNQSTTEPTTVSAVQDTQQNPSETIESTVLLSDILTQIKDNVTLPEMIDYSENDIKSQLGITAEDYSEVMCYVSNDGYYPDFIFIAKAKDAPTADKIESKLGNYRSFKINEWEDYLPDVPERFEAIERSKVTKSGEYLYLVISTEDADINGIINEILG